MPVVTIWEPRRYVAGFESLYTKGGNPAPVAGVRGGDTKVREVPRFEGTTVRRYREAGEMALTLYGVTLEDVQRGHLLELDGAHYFIERAALVEDGQAYEVEGRSVEALLDMEYDCYDVPGSMYNGVSASNVYYGSSATTITPLMLLQTFTGTNANMPTNKVAGDYPWAAGWWRDLDRKGDTMTQLLASAKDPAAAGTGVVRDFATYGAHLRTLCNLFGLGYRCDLTWSDTRGLYLVKWVVYEQPDTAVTMRATDPGVTGFEYEWDSHDRVNMVIYTYTDHYNTATGVYNKDGATFTHYGIKLRDGFMPVGSAAGEIANAAEFAENMAPTYVDLGAVPEVLDGVQIDGNPTQTAAWVESQIVDKVTGQFAKVEETASFGYDNSGAYKFGTHFGLGSTVALFDPRTGWASTQVLTEVTTTYSAGEAKAYAFDFGNRRRTTADKILAKFGDVDRRTASYK